MCGNVCVCVHSLLSVAQHAGLVVGVGALKGKHGPSGKKLGTETTLTTHPLPLPHIPYEAVVVIIRVCACVCMWLLCMCGG